MKDAISKISYVKEVVPSMFQTESPYINRIKIDRLNMADGSVGLSADIDDSHYYELLSNMTGTKIDGEYQLIKTMKDLSAKKGEYEKVEQALDSVRRKGYGVVAPSKQEITLAEPQVIRHGNKFGVKINAECPSIHMIKANIQTEIAPIVGSEEQAKDLITYIKENAARSEEGIWDTNIFGKSIEDIVDDGIRSKIHVITEDSQVKLQESMQKIINDSKGGLICIII
jgi:stage IV sporulation protein A